MPTSASACACRRARRSTASAALDVERLRERFADEGLAGVSPRFVINALSAAIIKSNAKSLTTMDVLLALKDAIESDARIDPKEKRRWIDFLVLARKDFYNRWVKEDVHKALFVSFEQEAQELLDKYLDEVEALARQPQDQGPDHRARSATPDERLLRAVEEKIHISDSGKHSFRQEVVRKAMGAYKRGEKFTLDSHAPLHDAIEQYLFEQRRDVLRLVSSTTRPEEETQQKISVVEKRLVDEYGYDQHSATRSAELRDDAARAGVTMAAREAFAAAGANPAATTSRIRFSAETPWYDLFSRGARDWLRHNQKVRQAVNEQLVDLLAGGDFITHPEERTVRVPVRLLEHARFRLADASSQTGAGQGEAQPGDMLRPPERASAARATATAATTTANSSCCSSSRSTTSSTGCGRSSSSPICARLRRDHRRDRDRARRLRRRGIRARLDRRRTVKEAVKRRAIQPEPVPFVDDDLRFRQLRQRPRPATNAVVIFALDVSVSMTAIERQLAKTFFFFALSGLRRQYHRVDVRFVAHTTDAWEFPEKEFFEVTGSGGTMASTAFRLALELLQGSTSRHSTTRTSSTRPTARIRSTIARRLRMRCARSPCGSTTSATSRPAPDRHASRRPTCAACSPSCRSGAPVGSHVLSEKHDVWQAIRQFFVQQADEAA